MLTHPTLDQLHRLGLIGMVKAFGDLEASAEAPTLSHPEWLGHHNGSESGCLGNCRWQRKKALSRQSSPCVDLPARRPVCPC